ncbi:hypothetical protein FBY26_0894 [Phycicoccus sp. SLBN-51]|jgi:hypothetical protein|nr:hypothetical protein FBY26_0894 [Phycicoccus sp. SLBN-51]
MRRVLTFLSALLLGLSSLFLAPVTALAHSAPGPGPISGYAAGDAVLGTGASAQHLTFAMVDSSHGDRGTVSYTNAAAGVAYNASVMAVEANSYGARFAYTIPSTAPASVRGLIIVWQVKDNSPDTAAFKVATSTSQALDMVDHGFMPTNSYTVSSGGLDTAWASTYGQRGYALGNAAFGTSPSQHLAFVVLDYGMTGDTGVAFYANLTSPLTYQAPTPVVRVDGTSAWFAYTIPAGNAFSGTNVVWKVTNGATDMVGFTTAPSATAAAAMVNAGSSITLVPAAGDITVVQLKRLLGHATGTVWFGPRGARQMMSFEVFDYVGAPDRGAVLYRNLSAGIAYRAYVHDVRVTPHTAYFDYVVPTGSLKGTIVVWKVSDYGRHHDHVGFSVASSLSAAQSMVENGFTPTNQYNVTRGNLTVHMP